MTKRLNKKKLIIDFQLMRDFERSARDQYLKMSQDTFVQQAGIQDKFSLISQKVSLWLVFQQMMKGFGFRSGNIMENY